MAVTENIRTFALDTETTGLADDDEILTVGICAKKCAAW